MEIYPLKTGTVKVKQAQQSREPGGMLRVLTSSEWTEWLPIYAWLIKHPEGNIVVDTGETARTSKTGYFPSWHPYFRYAVKMEVSSGQEIDRQLVRHGVDSMDVDTVILTHFHTDHAGGLYHFPNSRILAPGTDYRLARGLMGKLRGYLPQHWQNWFKPKEIEFQNRAYGPFPRSSVVTKDGSITIIPTPGHTPGHVSVVADTGDEKIFLAGDTTYNQELLLQLQPDGVSPDKGQAVETQKKILQLAENEPLAYLPSHDPESSQRLKNCAILDASKAKSDPLSIQEPNKVIPPVPIFTK